MFPSISIKTAIYIDLFNKKWSESQFAPPNLQQPRRRFQSRRATTALGCTIVAKSRLAVHNSFGMKFEEKNGWFYPRHPGPPPEVRYLEPQKHTIQTLLALGGMAWCLGLVGSWKIRSLVFQIPPEVRCFRYVVGVQIPNLTLGLWKPGAQTKRVQNLSWLFQSCMIFPHGGFGSLLPKQNPSEKCYTDVSYYLLDSCTPGPRMQSLVASMKGFGVGIREPKNVTSFWWWLASV